MAQKTSLPRAEHDIVIQGFSPRRGDVIKSFDTDGSYTVDTTEVIKFGAQTDVTIDGVTVTYNVGEITVLVPGVIYDFSSDAPVHIM